MNYVPYIFRIFSMLAVFLSSLLCANFQKAPETWVLIHGTFAARSEWPNHTSPTYQALAESVSRATENNYKIHTFRWSGHNNHTARLKAADELLQFLSTLTPPYHIVAHSHGVTVALLAAEKMLSTPKKFSIEELFSLGVPVHLPWYPNAHSCVKNFYNIFSYGDSVQTVVNIFERVFPEKPHVHNIQIKINHTCPEHSDLHDPLVFTALPQLRYLVHDKKKGEDKCYRLKISAVKKDFVDAVLEFDESRQADLKADHNFRQQVISLYGDSRNKLKKKVLVSLAPEKIKKEKHFQ